MTPDEERQLNAYLDGELDAAGVEAFEVLLLQRPDLAERVDADTVFGMAFKRYANSLPEPAVPPRQGAGSQLAAQVRKCRLPLTLAASSALLVGAVGGYLLSRSSASAESVSVAYVDQLRDASRTPAVHLPEDGALVLMAPVASAKPCMAVMTLDQSGSQVAMTRSRSDALGYAGLLVDASAIREGDATIGVACNGQPPMRYPLYLSRTAMTTESLHRS